MDPVFQLVSFGSAFLLSYVALCLLIRVAGLGLVWWCVPISLLLASTYAFNLHSFQGGTVYGGLSSDQALNLAYTNNVIHGNYLGDYYDKRVPAQYSPLYFWIVGTVARVCGWSALEAWRTFPIVLLLGLPFLVFAVGRRLGGDGRCGVYACFALLAVGSFHSAYFVGCYPYEASPYELMLYLLVKPHQILGGVLLVLWIATFARGPESPSMGWTLRQALLASLVFLFYSPWFVVGAVALGIHGLLGVPGATRVRYLVRLGAVCGLCAVATSIHWLRYVLALIEGGMGESYGTRYFQIEHLDPSWVSIGMGFFGLLFFLGVLGVAQWRRDPAVRGLGLGILVGYAWYGSTYVTYPLFDFAFLPHRCHILLTVLLAFAAAVGLERLREALATTHRERWLSPLCVGLIGVLMFPSLLRWNASTDMLLARAEKPLRPEWVRMVGVLDRNGPLTLAGGTHVATPAIAALSQTRMYTSPSPATANALMKERERMDRLLAVANRAQTPEELSHGLASLGIDALLLRQFDDGIPGMSFWEDPGSSVRAKSRSMVSLLIRGVKGEGRPMARGRVAFSLELLSPPTFQHVVDGTGASLYLRTR